MSALRIVLSSSAASTHLASTARRLRCRTFQGRYESRRGNSYARQTRHNPPLAFAFDIDGVLLQGNHVLPQARRALQMLEGDNELGIKIPYILITNGGGMSETLRCKRLTEQLGVDISQSRFMQAHTVLKSVVDLYADKPVLVLGGRPGAVPQAAVEYGFKKVYTTLDILAWNPSVWPFHELDERERSFVQSRPPFEPSIRFAAIFVFHDPRNWALDVQISCDILRSDGFVLPDCVSQNGSEAPVQLVFCNPDLLWGSGYPAPRFGQGAFRLALQAAYKALEGKEYPYTQYGKPTHATYEFAEGLLREQLSALRKETGTTDAIDYVPTVYMVGDNPESDIAGANATGWSSILVKTGVYSPKRGPPLHQPTYIADDVEHGVRWAINKECSRLQ